MKNGMFIQQVDTQKSAAGTPHKTFKHFKYAENIDTEENAYQFDAVVNSVQATRVPIARAYGGVEGSDNAYGTIVQGNIITGAGDGLGEMVAGPLIPSFAKQAAQAVSPSPRKEEVFSAIEQEANMTQDTARQIQELMEDPQQQQQQQQPQQHHPDLLPAPVAQPLVQTAPQPQQVFDPNTQPQQLKPVAPAPPPTEKVKISGVFGAFEGAYANVIVTEDVVVLLSIVGAPLYTPPVSKETFKISCNQGDFTVYFAGIQFELPFASKFAQVMIRDSA